MGLYTDKRKTTTTPDGYELLTHESGPIEYEFNWHMGPFWSKYLAAMRDEGKILGVKCPKCGTVYIPPRAVCGQCFVEPNEWVEVGPEGLLKGFTVVRFPYIDPNTGHLMKVPFTAVWITLDGADTRMMHFCNELDEHKMRVGMPMKAVFAKKPRPTSIHAVDRFDIIPGGKVVEELHPPRMEVPIKMELPTKKTAKRKGATAKKATKKKAAAKKK